MKKLITVLTILLFLLAGCSESKQQDEGFITVDVTKHYPEKEFILQDLFDIEYLPLETTDKFITTGSLQTINKDVIIMNDGSWTRSGNIYFVDRNNGKCLKTINRLGQSGEEYIFIGSVIPDEENQELYVNDPVTKRVLVYDLSGNFKRSFKSREGSTYQWVGDFDRDYLICCSEVSYGSDGSTSEEGIKNSGFMLVSKQDGSVRKIPIPYEKVHSRIIVGGDSPAGKLFYAIQNQPLIPYQGGWLLNEISADTIYNYSPDHKKNPFIVRTPSIQSMATAIYLYLGVLTDRYYFMQTVNKAFDLDKKEGFETTELVYDRQENSIYRYIVYNDDFTDKRDVNLVFKFPIPPVILNNNGIAYITRLEANYLMEAYEKGKLKGKLKEIAAGLEEDSNPVIMIAKHKK